MDHVVQRRHLNAHLVQESRETTGAPEHNEHRCPKGLGAAAAPGPGTAIAGSKDRHSRNLQQLRAREAGWGVPRQYIFR